MKAMVASLLAFSRLPWAPRRSAMSAGRAEGRGAGSAISAG